MTNAFSKANISGHLKNILKRDWSRPVILNISGDTKNINYLLKTSLEMLFIFLFFKKQE